MKRLVLMKKAHLESISNRNDVLSDVRNSRRDSGVFCALKSIYIHRIRHRF